MFFCFACSSHVCFYETLKKIHIFFYETVGVSAVIKHLLTVTGSLCNWSHRLQLISLVHRLRIKPHTLAHLRSPSYTAADRGRGASCWNKTIVAHFKSLESVRAEQNEARTVVFASGALFSIGVHTELRTSALVRCGSDTIWRDVGMACTRRTKTLVSTCVILSGMTNIVCLLYVGWVTNYIANVYIKVPMPVPAKKLDGDRKGETLRIIERLDRLENVVNQHIQGKTNVCLITVRTNVTLERTFTL